MSVKRNIDGVEVKLYALFTCAADEEGYTYPATDLFYCKEAGGFICDDCFSMESDWTVGQTLYEWLLSQDFKIEDLLRIS